VITPNQAYLQSGNLKKRGKNYDKKFNYEKAVVAITGFIK
jgi:putative transposase